MLQQVTRDLVCASYWSHASSVDQATVDEGLLVGDTWQRTAEYSFDWKQLGAGLIVASGRSHSCAGFGRPALRRKVPSGVAMWSNDVTPS